MTCVHLRQLYKLCQEQDLKLGGSDLIRVVCKQCDEQEVCPATLTDEYDYKESHQVDETAATSDERAEDAIRDQSKAD